MKLIIFGAPGAGKGTQAKNIVKHFNIEHISTGDLMRAEVKLGTELGKQLDEIMSAGQYVPDDITVKLLEKKLNDESTKNGFLLDGFPRTIEQVHMLEKIVPTVDKVVEIDVDNEAIVERLSSRRTCSKCGQIFNAKIQDLSSGICPKENCDGELVQRKDDNPETIRKRLEVYEQSTKPIIKHYEEKGIVVKVNGIGDVDEISKEIISKIEM